MAELYKGYEINVKNDTNWADRENAFHKRVIDDVVALQDSTQPEVLSGNGYYGLLTDYFSGGVGTSNLIEVADLNTWLDMDITVDVVADNRTQAMKDADPVFFDPITKEFNLEGLTTSDHIVVSAGISYTPEIDFGTLRSRLLFTSHSGATPSSFEIEGRALDMNSGADEQYATIGAIPVFIGDLIDTNGVGDAGKFKIQFQSDVEGELILREYKVFVYKGGN